MPARWNMGLALLALSVAGPLQAQPLGAQEVINRCAGVSSALTGLSPLRKACPGLEAALAQLGLTARLPVGWSKTLSASGLADLTALLGRYSGAPPSQPPPAATLRSIASALIARSPPPSWSQRLETWIRHWTVALLNRLGRWLRSLGPAGAHSALARVLICCLMALVLASVLLVLFALGGRGRSRWRRSTSRARGARIAGGLKEEPAAAQFDEAEWAHSHASPTRILRLLVDALTRSHRLERDRHLTCRELEARVRLDTEAERQDFARVARLAERELYGPPGTTLLPEETLRGLKLLHARLLAAAGKGAASPS